MQRFLLKQCELFVHSQCIHLKTEQCELVQFLRTKTKRKEYGAVRTWYKHMHKLCVGILVIVTFPYLKQI